VTIFHHSYFSFSSNYPLQVKHACLVRFCFGVELRYLPYKNLFWSPNFQEDQLQRKTRLGACFNRNLK
jgi:hypothetical protein